MRLIRVPKSEGWVWYQKYSSEFSGYLGSGSASGVAPPSTDFKLDRSGLFLPEGVRKGTVPFGFRREEK